MVRLSLRSRSSSLLCSVRFLVTILACFCLVVNYLQRVNLTQAIISMTDMSTICINSTSDVKIPRSRTVDWSRKTEGLVLSAYFYGYLITQAAGGVLAYKFGPQKVLIISVTGSSLFTLCTPLAAEMSAVCMFAVRFLLGLLASVNWPALLQLLSEWSPKQERSRLIAISNSGAQLGTIIALPLTGLLCDQSFMGGWPLVFYASGFFGLIWVVIWALVARSRPESHHFISNEEKNYIIENRAVSNTTNGRIRVPYNQIFRSIPCWGMFASHFFKAVGFYTILTNISRYNKDILNLDVKKSGFLSSIPYISYWIMTIICGFSCDKVINSGKLSRTTVRKIFTGLGNFLPGLFILIIGFIPSSTPWAGTLLFTLVLATTGFNTGGGMYCSANDMAPRFAGIIWGISNTFGNLPGIICPTMVGWIVKDGSITQWRIVFIICSVCYVLSGLSFILTGSGEVQEWAKAKEPENAVEEPPNEALV